MSISLNLSNISNFTTDHQCHHLIVTLPESEFPDDLFTLKQRQSGAILLHFLAMIYSIGIF